MRRRGGSDFVLPILAFSIGWIFSATFLNPPFDVGEAVIAMIVIGIAVVILIRD